MNLQTVPCPLCGQTDSFIDVRVPGGDAHIHKYGALYAGMTKSGWKICGLCGFLHQNPRPSAEALNTFYLQSKYHADLTNVSKEAQLEFARWYYSEKLDFATRHGHLECGRVFDIGCGQGEVLKLCEERGWKAYGVEPDQVLSNYAIKELGLSGVRQGILDRHFELEEKVDLVFSNHAFEHFADLDEVMRGICRILRRDGYLFIAVPTYYKNKSSLSKRWMNSAHYSLFTHNSLNSLVSRYGFDEVAHTYSGWKKEVDDLWYLAKFTEAERDPALYFEDPKHISRYLKITNPTRSLFFYPIYSHWAMRVYIYTVLTRALRLLMTSPVAFFQKLASQASHLFLGSKR